MTETILWQALSGSKLGVAFRRQVPIGRYIADFLAPACRLVVEVDGGYHATPARLRADARRDRLPQLVLHDSRWKPQHPIAQLGKIPVALVAQALAP